MLFFGRAAKGKTSPSGRARPARCQDRSTERKAQRSRTGARGSLMFPLQERRPRTVCARVYGVGEGSLRPWGFDRQGGARKRGVQGGGDRGGGRQGACPFDPGKVRGPALQSSRACTKPNPRGFSLSRLPVVSRKLASGVPTCWKHTASGSAAVLVPEWCWGYDQRSVECVSGVVEGPTAE